MKCYFQRTIEYLPQPSEFHRKRRRHQVATHNTKSDAANAAVRAFLTHVGEQYWGRHSIPKSVMGRRSGKT